VIEAVIRGARRNVMIDTSSKSAIARIEEAGNGTNASKEQIRNVASAKTTAGTSILATWLRN
jgi:16S rRNA G966 N2-methylase RsmD